MRADIPGRACSLVKSIHSRRSLTNPGITRLRTSLRTVQNSVMTRLACRARRVLVFVAVLMVASAATNGAGAQRVPTRLADSTFWRLMNEMSEPWGTFRSENFVSNETALQWVIPKLVRRVPPGGVYIGVAPDQNFTLITALKPSIAFIVDIRHQNAVQHLM